MQLVDRQQLMNMPEGTVYSPWEPCILGELMIKGETIKDGDRNIDWYETPVGPTINTNEYTFELDDSICREAFFDEERRYLVYSNEEIEMMVKKLTGIPLDRSVSTPFEC